MMEQLDQAVENINQALSLLDSCKSEIADLEARSAAAGAGSPAPVEDFTSQVVTNADGSVIVTLTPDAPATVSAAEPVPTGEQPAGTVEADQGPGQPTPTGQ